jgi:hypothetical protein
MRYAHIFRGRNLWLVRKQYKVRGREASQAVVGSLDATMGAHYSRKLMETTTSPLHAQCARPLKLIHYIPSG